MVSGLVACGDFYSCMVNCHRYRCTQGSCRQSDNVSLPLAGVLLASAVACARWTDTGTARPYHSHGTALGICTVHRDAAPVRMGGRCAAATHYCACMDT